MTSNWQVRAFAPGSLSQVGTAKTVILPFGNLAELLKIVVYTEFPTKMVIFHSCVSLPEGTWYSNMFGSYSSFKPVLFYDNKTDISQIIGAWFPEIEM